METFPIEVHGIRGLITAPRFLLAPVRRELGFFKSSAAPDQPDFTVRAALGPAAPAVPGSPQWEGTHLGARFSVLVESKTPVALSVRCNLLTRFVFSKWLCEPALRMAAHGAQALMVHAAALTDGKRGLLVAGEGGAGKTTWVLDWISAGHPYLSDDFSFIKNHALLPYVTPMRIGYGMLKRSSTLSALSFVRKAEIAARTAIRQMSLGKVKFYYKARPGVDLPGARIAEKAELFGAVVISSRIERPRRIDAAEMSSIVSAIDGEELHGFRADAVCGPSYAESHRRMIEEALAGRPCYLAPARHLPPARAKTSVSSLLGWMDELE